MCLVELLKSRIFFSKCKRSRERNSARSRDPYAPTTHDSPRSEGPGTVGGLGAVVPRLVRSHAPYGPGTTAPGTLTGPKSKQFKSRDEPNPCKVFAGIAS